MLNSPPTSASGGGSRRSRYTRSPGEGSPNGGGMPPSKRSKPSNSVDAYDRNHGGSSSRSDQKRLYTSICVKNINPKIPDLEVRQLCNKKFSKYGPNTVKIYYKNQERVAFVNFNNCEDAKKARHAKTGLVWENMQVILEPVYYRRTVPAEQPLNPNNSRDHSPPSRRYHHRASPSPPPPVFARPYPHHSGHMGSSYHHPTSSRQRHPASPPYPSPYSRGSRGGSRRTYSPYIPLPPDLLDFVSTGSKHPHRHRQHSSPSPPSRHRHPPPPPPPPRQSSKQQRARSRSATSNASSSSSTTTTRKNRTNTDTGSGATGGGESAIQHEPTRTLFVGNLEREITESKLKEIFGRYGAIEEIDLKKPQASTKRAYAFIQYENMDMAYEARRNMDGRLIGKADCKIGYGKIVPTNCLWVGNLPIDLKRRDLEHAFARYGQIKALDYSNGDPTAFVTYNDIEDAIRARSKLSGTTQLVGGQKVRAESTHSGSSTSSRRGFRIDFIDRASSRRFVIVRPQNQPLARSNRKTSARSSSGSRSRDGSSRSSSHSPSPKDRLRSVSSEAEHDNDQDNEKPPDLKTESRSRSPTPPSLTATSKVRHSTDVSRSPPPPINPLPTAGRTFYGPLGSYLSPNDSANVTNINELMVLCEQLNLSASQANSALATVYPVQFILKSHAYDARMHFLAGNPALASVLLGQPGDLVAAKTELKVTQRLRLDPHKLEDLERKLRLSVTSALAAVGIAGTNSTTSVNGPASNGSTAISVSRKQLAAPSQTKFVILITSPKTRSPIDIPNESSILTAAAAATAHLSQRTTNGKIKHEATTPPLVPPSAESNEFADQKEHHDEDATDDDELSLSRLISYLAVKEAAGVISIPFHPTSHNDHPTQQETAVLHIFPPCQFSKKVIKLICPSINFSNGSHTPPSRPTTMVNDEHLMVVIIRHD